MMTRRAMVRRSLLAATLFLIADSSARAQLPGEEVPFGGIHMGAFSNVGGLTTDKYFRIIQSSGGWLTGYDTAKVRSGAFPGSGEICITSASLTNPNETGDPITLNPSPSITIKAFGKGGGGKISESTISLGSQSASGSSSTGTYSDPKTVTFAVVNLGNGQTITQSGSWSASCLPSEGSRVIEFLGGGSGGSPIDD
jgi:hypothetical protein